MTSEAAPPAAGFSPARFTLATARHADTVLALMREFYVIEHLALDEPQARAAVEELLGHRTLGAIFLIESDEDTIVEEAGPPAGSDVTGGSLLGYGVVTFSFSLEFHGRFALLDELYLREAARGRGLGKASLAFVEEFCRHEGIRTLRLEVSHENARARAVYERAGYVTHNRDLLTKLLSGV